MTILQTPRESDITLAAAVRNFFSRSLHALGVEVGVPPTISRALKDALLAGMRV